MAESKSPQSVKQLIADLKAFAIELADMSGEYPDTQPFIPSTMFSAQDYGSLALSGDEADRYSRIVAGLLEKMGEKMSERSVSKLVQTALLKTIDPKGRDRASPVSARAEQAANEVQLALASPMLEWLTCVPILGLSPPRKAWKLNTVTIIDITRKEGKALLNAADSITDRTTNANDEKSLMKAATRQRLIAEHPGQAFALVTTLALDIDAAWASAKRRLQFTLDCLNLAVDFLVGNTQHYELSMDQPRRRHYATGITVNATNRTSMQEHAEVNSPSGILNAETFRADIRKHRALRTLVKYLENDKPNSHQNRVLSAAQWAGRAQADRRAEEAFLHRAIALEALILGDRDNAELSMRLTLSIVHLLGDMLRSRQNGFQKIKRLYSVRSKIVHSGKYEVDKEDITLMRSFVIRVFARVLGDNEFVKMTEKNDLDSWFESRMRGERAVQSRK
jgi:hypothetical protein